MSWRENLGGYLTFTARERLAVVCLILLITGVFLLPHIFSSSGSTAFIADTSWMRAVVELKEQREATIAKRNYTPGTGSYSKPHQTLPFRGTLFYFDPNTLDAAGWSRLGLREKTIGTILKYRDKGGRFRTALDLERVYGLFPDEYARIAPYVRIESPNTVTVTEQLQYVSSKPVYSNTYRGPPAAIDINIADTIQWKSLPAIGSKLAQRIVLFRERLGGFYSIEQVKETFGLPDSSFQKIKPYLKLGSVLVRKIRINTVTLDELKTHPYIRYSLAAALISYRTEHGAFKKLDELTRVVAMTVEIFERLKPYLELD